MKEDVCTGDEGRCMHRGWGKMYAQGMKEDVCTGDEGTKNMCISCVHGIFIKKCKTELSVKIKWLVYGTMYIHVYTCI